MDARQEIKMYIFVILFGFSLLSLGQILWLKTIDNPVGIVSVTILFIPIYSYWLWIGAPQIMKRIKNYYERKNK